uniref:Ubc protein n=1 Tax=Solanum lycopersicum TaxID=4081 RepID=V9GZD2_SOLLC|nr:Ubc [Solanum lycopersicum]
MSYVLGVNE